MTENIKRVTNPLTIIAIFAALAEVNSTVAIGLVGKEHQGLFLWFVILFPTLLIVLFFATLNANPKVIYAPSDFKNEEHFLKTVSGEIYSFGKKAQVSFNKETIKSIDTDTKEIQTYPLSNDKVSGFRQQEIFKKIAKKLEVLFEANLISGVGVSVKNVNYYLLTIKFSQKRFTTLTEPQLNFSFIIRFPPPGDVDKLVTLFDFDIELSSKDIDTIGDAFVRHLNKIGEKLAKDDAAEI
ncbi:hypothetical protein [Dyadobacter fermentans]|uniref:Uncharacterized protein n=1 Tax=Dyadobacter fermentans (strain ATCC 700827 / DSM 18053 / CIP 107007 / KCTC 52180 / NS114) TaxID=471854 RepID=C6VVG0_DYAFD|nr:hypothetical protein [Dyadobacter fermentans]ACT96690.1 hypothetical protein Dfer_5499 [Dyadobacter fermentans DSM 18053]